MLQEFKISRALGLSFKAWFRNFVPFTLLAAALYAPILIYIATYKTGGEEDVNALLNHVFIYPIYAVVAASTLLAPMLTYRVVQDLNGHKVSILTSIKFGLRGIIPALILAGVTNVLQMLPMGGIFAAVITCIWFVAAPSAVAEQLGPFAALSRSATLTSGRRWGIFGLLFLIGLAQMGLMMAWIIPMFSKGGLEWLANLRSTSLMFIGTMAVFQMFTGIVEAVSYALLRQDKDGVTHEELARVFE